ncbi:multiple inositol polyphosphate phosphatase 1-like [Mytilus galloprovincialis]|uniref:multiple inositol polyphosphate phosphatase 1-like n=1 Tax=Mytilus galloprovincialis TaxID=29158 RepID=UPI003F7B4E5A
MLSYILSIVVLATVVVELSECGTNFMKPVFNVMTPYSWAKDRYVNDTVTDESNVMYNGEVCQIVNLNLLMRHVARYPSLYWIRRMKNLHKMMNNNPDVVKKHKFLKTWIIPFAEENAYSMSALGNEEAATLGRTFGEKFKQLFEGKMDLIDYTITSKEVTQQSFHAFHKSLNGTILADAPMPIPTVDDERLRFYSKCKKYRTYSDKSNVEYDSFVGGTKMRTVVDKIKKLLGVKNLKTEQVITMHQICAFELGMFNQSEWCSFFTLDDLLVLDYLFDLSHFWQRGFGYPINWQMSCPFTSHIFKRFDDIIAYKNETTVADIQFAHSYTLLPVYTAFGLFKDSNTLLANNFESHKSRLFRVSSACPFSANLGTALYKCGVSGNFVVKMFVNEEEVNIPACGSKVCLYQDFKQAYKLLGDCDFQKICKTQ